MEISEVGLRAALQARGISRRQFMEFCAAMTATLALPQSYVSAVAEALRHEDIAFMVGTSRESVTRTLSDFRRRRILSVEGATLTILQRKELEQML